jgi:hypothetical protein
LVALISKISGYTGNIKNGELIEWKYSTNSVEYEWYKAKITQKDGTFKLTWPTFNRPTLPDNPLVGQLAGFASILRDKTSNEVFAKLQPYPDNSTENIFLDFKLLLTCRPDQQISLFTVSVTNNALEIGGWEDEPCKITTTSELLSFWQNLINSKRMITQIQKLLILSDEIHNGAQQ